VDSPFLSMAGIVGADRQPVGRGVWYRAHMAPIEFKDTCYRDKAASKLEVDLLFCDTDSLALKNPCHGPIA
jgi:hypothetical protein